MIFYTYTALDENGIKQNGEVEAIDELSATHMIEKKGLIPLSINTKTEKIHSDKKLKKIINFDLGFRIKPKMKLQDLLLFSRELSDLVASGMTVGRALHTLANRKEKIMYN